MLILKKKTASLLAECIKEKFGEDSEEYLGHDWKTFEGKKDNFGRNDANEPVKEDLNYGFVQGKSFDYDVLVNDRAEGYRNYQYFEVPNEIGNRNFDFALSNVRVGYIYIDITKAWHDGEATSSTTCKYRPDALKVRVQYTDYESRELKTEDG